MIMITIPCSPQIALVGSRGCGGIRHYQHNLNHFNLTVVGDHVVTYDAINRRHRVHVHHAQTIKDITITTTKQQHATTKQRRQRAVTRQRHAVARLAIKQRQLPGRRY